MWVDTHSHLYQDVFKEDWDQVLTRLKDAKVDHVFLPNIDLDSIAPMMHLVDNRPDVFYPMMGLHPCDVKSDYETVLEKMEALFTSHQFYGVGETGIDLFWDKTTLDIQIKALEIQIEWAKKYNLPIILHARDSFNEILVVIEKHHDAKLRGIFHCFTGSEQIAQRILKLESFMMGIGGVVSYPKAHIKETLKKIPLTHIVLETDSPFLPPTPYRGKRNESSYIPIIGEHLVDAYGGTLNEIAQVTTSNAKRIFGIQ
jgi:TatD DNase family protein